jgi:hypothetical protein
MMRTALCRAGVVALALGVSVLVVAASVSSSASARTGDVERGIAPATVHRLVLPEPRRAATGRDWSDLDVAPGEAPSADFPWGTVVVAEATAWEPTPSVTEWDLARAVLVRSVALPLSAAFCDLQMVRAGRAFHLVASEGRGGRVVYVRLGEHLDIEVLDGIGSGERPRVATDGTLVAVLWSGRRDRALDDPGWQLVTFDGAGRLGEGRVTRGDDSTFLVGDPLAVARGRVFVLATDGTGPRVVVLARDARPEAVRVLSWTPDDGRLFAAADRVYFTDDCRTMEIAGPTSAPPSPALGSPLPGRPLGVRACVAFEAASDAAGRLVTTEGDVRDAAFRVESHPMTPDGIVMRALWIHGAPAWLVAGGPGGRASLAWIGP